MAEAKVPTKSRRQKKSGTVRQLESGGWQAIVRRKGHKQESHTFRTKTEADKWARRIQTEIDNGSFISAAEAERTLFKDLAKSFENEFAPLHYRGGSWKHKLAHLVDRLGNLSLIAINAKVITKYRDDRLKDPDPRYKDAERAPRVSGPTVKSELDLLSKVLSVATTEFGIALPLGNPVKSIKKPASNPGRTRRVGEEEWKNLLIECKRSRNTWLLPAVILAVESSMRQGESLTILWENVDIENKLVMLPDASTIKNGEPRPVPLSSRAIAVIQNLPQKTKGKVIPLPRRTLYGAFVRAVKRAGIEDLTYHDLRHEALSRLTERGGFEVLELAAVSGHKDLRSLKRYVHLKATKLAEKMG